jgi:hypothetical protein
MSDEQDRVLLLSDLRALESGLVERISSESEKLRQQFDARIISEGQETRRHFESLPSGSSRS